MELRKTEQKINDLLVEYEGIRRSPVWKPEQQALLPPIPKEAAAPSAGTVASPRDEESLVGSLRSTEASLAELLPRVARFRKRLFEIDPVTEKPRYGPKSRDRVRVLVRKHGFLCDVYRTTFPEEEKQQWLATRDYQAQQLALREERQNERRKDHAKRLEELAKQQQEQAEAEAKGKDNDDDDGNGESQEPLPISDVVAAAAAATSTDASLNPDGSIIVDPEGDVCSDANPEPPTRGNASPSSLLFARVQNLHERKQREELDRKASEEEQKQREEEERRLALAEEEALKKAVRIREASERAARELAERQRLHRQAEEARLRRRAQEEARKEAEKNWLEGIRKGPEGVRHYLDVLLQRTETTAKTNSETNSETGTATTTTSIDPDRIVALRSLCILFEQIQKHPEEVNKRKIKRSNPNFHRDIGRHEGGVELLVAAGFRPTTLPIADGESGTNDGGGGDGGDVRMTEPGNDEEEPPEIAFLISKEPNLEHDMDGWMAWFDLNKATLEILQNELEKIEGKNKRSRR